MASDYSATPLATKLGIKSGHRVILIGAPIGWSIPNLPERVTIGRRITSPADVVIAFFHDPATLSRNIVKISSAITADGALWISWPRRAPGHMANITDTDVRNTMLPLGLVDVKVAALVMDYSALKFVWRKELRAARS